MGIATGRDPHAATLASTIAEPARLAMPAICYMEALSAFEDERRRRHGFSGQIEHQMSQLRRDTTSSHAKALLGHLEQARIANGRLLGDVQDRLFRAVEQVCELIEIIPLSPGALRESMKTVFIKEPTDNLILTSILEHGREHPEGPKAFLSGNFSDFDVPDVRTALAAVGITKYFRTAENVLSWLMSGGL
jgi:hypothetical protein